MKHRHYNSKVYHFNYYFPPNSVPLIHLLFIRFQNSDENIFSNNKIWFNSLQLLNGIQLFATPWMQHARLPCPSPAPEAYSNSCPLGRWCHPTSSSSVVPITSCLQSFPASGSFPISQLISSGSKSIEVSYSSSLQWVFKTDFL